MIVEVVLSLPFQQSFYYQCPVESYDSLQPGQRVLVPFQNRRLMAYVVDKHVQLPSDFPADATLKEILLIIDKTPLISKDLFTLCHWISDYYFAPLGDVLKTCLPLKTRGNLKRYTKTTSSGVDQAAVWSFHAHKLQWAVSLNSNLKQVARLTPLQQSALEALETTPAPLFVSELAGRLGISAATIKALQKKRVVTLSRQEVRRDPFRELEVQFPPQLHTLTAEQQQALAATHKLLRSGVFAPVLLHGVTGSGKTEIYLSLIESMLKTQHDSLVLMPEIGLTPRVAQEFRARLGHTVAILHSALAEGERHDEWWRIYRGEARVVIGTRSAVFAPLSHLKLIVVDEEHDPSYKQQESPHYNARDLALVRGKMANALVVLGSATPAIETFYNAQKGKYHFIRLTSRVQARPMPRVRLVDMRADFASSGRTVISQEMEAAIRERLARQEQVLILMNRRGFSTLVLCRSCGQNIQCKNCSISLAYHKSSNTILCHYCGYHQKVPKRCPACGSEYLYFLGEGTEKIETMLQKAFPAARISRLDRDVAQRKNARTRILREFQMQEVDILVGTQMISKGHDFHNVTLVGILSADNSLSLPDFRCAERTFDLLTQMSGRAGRGDLPGEVLIQTYYPEHYCLKYVTQHDYEGFYEKEIRFRRFMHYPPFASLAVVQVRHKSLDAAAEIITQFGKLLRQFGKERIRVLGPALAPLARIKSEHRFQIILKSPSRSVLNKTLRQSLLQGGQQGLEVKRIHIDIDPVNLM